MLTLSLTNVIWIDLCTIAVCAIVALRSASSLLHPSGMMIACHAYIVTLRLFQLLRGMHPMAYDFVWKVGEAELLRAALASDLALVSMAGAWILIRWWSSTHPTARRKPQILLSASRVRAVAMAVPFVGLVGLMVAGPN